jgi:hypothetical protein
LFDWGSEPIADVAAYPPFEEVLRTYRELRGRNLQLLDETGVRLVWIVLPRLLRRDGSKASERSGRRF